MGPTLEQVIDKLITKLKGNNMIKQYIKQKSIEKISSIAVAIIQRRDTSINSTSVLEEKQHYQRWDHTKNVLELTDTLKDSHCRSFFDNFSLLPN